MAIKKENKRKLIWISSILVMVIFIPTFLLVKHNTTNRGADINLEDYHVFGIDISSHNGKVDFSKLEKGGVDFIIMKATEGATFKDSLFDSNYEMARKYKFKIGAYHFFNFNVPGIEQAHNLLNSVDGKKLDLPLVIDVEKHGNPFFTMTSTAVRNLQDMIDELEIQQREIMIYTNKKGYERYVKEDFQNFPLWICTFSEPSDSIPWTIWQYSHWGTVEGIEGDVDLDVFYGDEKQWNKWIK